eukprot:6188561-Pleurochrysis_carterae.AAC.1
MSHNASTFALLSVRTLTLHTLFVAPRLALLHNCTVSTPTVCSLCDTPFTAPSQRPTRTTAHLSGVAMRRRTAHICIGAATKQRAAALTAHSYAMAAMYRTATHLTKYAESALRPLRASAAATKPTVNILLSSRRRTTLSPGSQTSTCPPPTNYLFNNRKGRH